MENNTDNKPMRLHGDYFTVQEMAKCIGVTPKVVNMRLFRLGIKPITRDALYTSGDFENIKNVTMGRPKNKNIQAKTGKSKPEKTAVVKSPEKKKQSSAKK